MKEEEKRKSSTFRELKGILVGLKVLAHKLEAKRVKWINDNWAASLIVKYGSMKPELHSLEEEIMEVCQKFRIELKVEWLSRESDQVNFFDKMSKDFDSAEYRILEENFEELEEKFGPFSVDLFASEWTYQMKPYYSKFLCTGSSGVDAFA